MAALRTGLVEKKPLQYWSSRSVYVKKSPLRLGKADSGRGGSDGAAEEATEDFTASK